MQQDNDPKLSSKFHHNMRDWWSHTGKNYFKVLLLKEVLKATESQGELHFTGPMKKSFLNGSMVFKYIKEKPLKQQSLNTLVKKALAKSFCHNK